MWAECFFITTKGLKMKNLIVSLLISLLAFSGAASATDYSCAISGKSCTAEILHSNLVKVAAIAIIAVAVYDSGKENGKPATRLTVEPTANAKGGQVKLTRTF